MGGLVALIFAPPARLAIGASTGSTPAILSLIGACPDAACTRPLVTARQSEAGLKLFAEQCEQGRATMCITLSLLAKARGDATTAASWEKKPCDLGAKEACR